MLCLRCSVDIATVDDVSRMVISARPCGCGAGWQRRKGLNCQAVTFSISLASGKLPLLLEQRTPLQFLAR